MQFKSLAVAGAAAAALSAGIAAPAFAAPENHEHGGCHHFCVATVSKGGVKYGTVHVFVTDHSIKGVLHLTKDAKKGWYKIKGHCKPVEHEHEHERTFVHHEVRFIPRGSTSTGFGGGEQLNLPLTGGALAMIAGGLGVGVLARRRLSGARS